MTSARVWSLREMLEKLRSEEMVRALTYLASTAKVIGGLRAKMIRENLPTIALARGDDIALSLKYTNVVGRIAEQLHMSGVVNAVASTRLALVEAMPVCEALSREALANLLSLIDVTLSSFGNELDARKLFVMDPRFAAYYEPREPLFGQDVADAFADCADDIEEAGKCLALGASTACVFHLMRAAEGAAARVSTKLGGATHKPVKGNNDELEPLTFGGLYSEVATKVGEMKSGPKKDAWLHLEGLMRALNRGTRTKVCHAGSWYPESKAETVFGQTKAFMLDAEELLRA